MSSFVSIITPEKALIATDTLAVNPDGSPRNFTSKALVLPHMRLIVAGTGVSGLASSWFRAINEHMVSADIDQLNRHTQEALKGIWETEFGDIDVHQYSTTIYHIGLSRETGKIHGYTYSSMNDFEPRELAEGFSWKPPMHEHDDGQDAPASFMECMKAQMATQERLPFYQRIHIGGEVQVITITSDGLIACYSDGQLPEFEELETQILVNFHAYLFGTSRG